MRDNSNDPTPYAVYCREHKLQFLEEGDYQRQMDRPNSKWRCPVCRDEAEWDDDCQETNPPEPEEGESNEVPW